MSAGVKGGGLSLPVAEALGLATRALMRLGRCARGERHLRLSELLRIARSRLWRPCGILSLAERLRGPARPARHRHRTRDAVSAPVEGTIRSATSRRRERPRLALAKTQASGLAVSHGGNQGCMGTRPIGISFPSETSQKSGTSVPPKSPMPGRADRADGQRLRALPSARVRRLGTALQQRLRAPSLRRKANAALALRGWCFTSPARRSSDQVFRDQIGLRSHTELR